MSSWCYHGMVQYTCRNCCTLLALATTGTAERGAPTTLTSTAPTTMKALQLLPQAQAEGHHHSEVALITQKLPCLTKQWKQANIAERSVHTRSNDTSWLANWWIMALRSDLYSFVSVVSRLCRLKHHHQSECYGVKWATSYHAWQNEHCCNCWYAWSNDVYECVKVCCFA